MANIAIQPLPQPSVIATNTVCEGQVVVLQGFGGRGYQWSGPNNFNLSFQTSTFTALSQNMGGTFTLIVTDSIGCRNSMTLPITILQAPGGGLWGSRNERCVPFCSDFKLIPNTQTGFSITDTKWYMNDRLVPGDSTFKINYCFASPGIYTLTGMFEDGRCPGRSSFVIHAWPVPGADFSYLPARPVENGEPVFFTNTSTGKDSLNQLTDFSWHIRDKGAEVTRITEHTSYYFDESGIYPVAMVVKSDKGCSDTIVKLITVRPDFGVYIPNAFTPDDNGNNELFYPVTRNIKLLKFSVFDRWGEMLFSTTDPGTGWDGTFRGQPCKQDVYHWILEVSGKEGENKKMNGSVTLLR
jgi:gliding motility-associated-like protein